MVSKIVILFNLGLPIIEDTNQLLNLPFVRNGSKAVTIKENIQIFNEDESSMSSEDD